MIMEVLAKFVSLTILLIHSLLLSAPGFCMRRKLSNFVSLPLPWITFHCVPGDSFNVQRSKVPAIVILRWVGGEQGRPPIDAHQGSNTRKCSLNSTSLRSRRLEVVGTRKNARARRRHARGEGALPCRRSLTPRVPPSRAPVLSFAHYFQVPARHLGRLNATGKGLLGVIRTLWPKSLTDRSNCLDHRYNTCFTKCCSMKLFQCGKLKSNHIPDIRSKHTFF